MLSCCGNIKSGIDKGTGDQSDNNDRFTDNRDGKIYKVIKTKQRQLGKINFKSWRTRYRKI